MHGGMKVYAGSPAAARQYLEAGCGRADDYYLAEGTGIAGTSPPATAGWWSCHRWRGTARGVGGRPKPRDRHAAGAAAVG